MTITINVPVFPLRKEIAARKRRLALSLGLPLRGTKDATKNTAKGNKGTGTGPDPRYTADGLEFDVSDLMRAPARTGKADPEPRGR